MSGAPVFVINPKSHKVSARGSVLAQAAVDFGDIPIIYYDGSNDLAAALDPHMSQRGNTLYIEGGDGTIVAALTASLENQANGNALPKFAILPGGSTNLAHKVLGLVDTDLASLNLRLADHGAEHPPLDTITHKALMVETSETKSPYVGVLLSTGSLSRAMLYTQQNLHDGRRGSVAIARAVLQLGLFPKATTFHDGLPVVRPSQFLNLTEHVDAAEPEQAFSIFSTFDKLSLGMRPFWNRGDAPIGFTKGAWPIQGLRTGVAKLAAGRTGKSLEKHGLSSKGCDEIEFRCDGPVVFDGEELPMPADQTFKVSASPDLEFIR